MRDVWRLVDSDLVPPLESVALDEAILESHVIGSVPNTLHFYRRDRPTVSIGYFQRVSTSVDEGECERRGVAIVRRKSGGGSIYTDKGQLIYGLVVHEADLPRSGGESFELVCSAIARAIARFGAAANYRPMNDVEVNGRKISGSAQLRRKGSVLMHGTILVDTDIETMDAVLRIDPSKIPGIRRPSERIVTLGQLLSSVPEMDSVKAAVVSEVEKALGAQFELGRVSTAERITARKLVKERYSLNDWNYRF